MELKERRQKLRMEDFALGPLIGVSAYSTIRVGRHKTSGRTYAVKIYRKYDLNRAKMTDKVIRQIQIQETLSHPFIAGLEGFAQDNRHVYLVEEMALGSQLFKYLESVARLPSGLVLHIAAQLTLAIQYLHDRNVVYRDLKPENIVIGHDGYIKLVDFGMSKKVVDRTYSLCGTMHYLAPQVILAIGHSKPVDWWALGVIIYELLVGVNPFQAGGPQNVLRKILAGVVTFPVDMDPDLQALIKDLLVADQNRRLGSYQDGKELRNHRVFGRVDWTMLHQKRYSSFKLQVQNERLDQGQPNQGREVDPSEDQFLKNWSQN